MKIISGEEGGKKISIFCPLYRNLCNFETYPMPSSFFFFFNDLLFDIQARSFSYDVK